MKETHPFGKFVPKNARYLMLGNFPGREVFSDPQTYDWFYSTKRNQFWPIMRLVYSRGLVSKAEKEWLFTELKLAISDITYQCERKNSSNLDENLINVIYNFEIIDQILEKNRIEKIFFTSKFVETSFKKEFKTISGRHPYLKYATLPSPSPRYARMNIAEKAKVYKLTLPKLSEK